MAVKKKTAKNSIRKATQLPPAQAPAKNPSYRSLFMLLAVCVVIYGLLSLFFAKPQTKLLSAQELKQYVSKEGYAFSYPKDWKIGIGSSVMVANDQNYINFYVNNVASKPPNTGVKADWVVEKDIVPSGTPLRVALTYGDTSGQMPLLADQYLTINGIPAYRQIQQTQDNQGTTKTAVNYNLLKDNTLYKFNCEIDSNNPQQLMQACDTIAKSFKLVR